MVNYWLLGLGKEILGLTIGIEFRKGNVGLVNELMWLTIGYCGVATLHLT